MNKEIIGKKLILSLSGGIDSVYLFHKLRKNNVEFVACHINHQTRGSENEDEYLFCQKLCSKYNIGLEYFLFQYTGGNFQNEARNYRQQVLIDVVHKYNYDGVATAHHKDDQIENILMSENRISNRLMKAQTIINDVVFYKPLLDTYKSEIYEYMQSHNYLYKNDSSNFTNNYLRNTIRNEQLSKLNVAEKENLYQEELARTNYYLPNCSEITIDKITNEYMLNLFVEQNGFNVNHHFIKMVYNSLTMNGNKQFMIDNNNSLYLNYGTLRFGKNIYISEGKKKLVAGLNTFNNFEFNYENNELYVRSANANDYFKQNKINRYFINNKIPKQFRTIWPIIVDKHDKIIYILTTEEIL